MVVFDTGATLAERFRSHFGGASHLYGHAVRGMADDWEAGGPVRDICRGWEDSPSGTVVQLRLLAGVFRIVLDGRAPELEPFYACLGGTAGPEGVWPVLREVLAEHVVELARGLELAPQTNEPGRSAALLVGIFEAVRQHGLRRVRLLEPGASGGLNLLVDRFRYAGVDWTWGPEDSPLLLDTKADRIAPQDFSVVDRVGCDVAPVAAHTPAGAAYLTSFVWPWQLHRHERLRAALEVVRQHPVTVEAAGAGEWLERRLADPVDDDVLTIVWQSITRMYWPPEETRRTEAAVAQARSRIPLAHVTMEHEPGDGPAADAALAVDGRILGLVHPHGIPLWI
ncbi:MAG TPA: DUF2332 domain-containing protein [Dermatophilaceae bacterium]|nr:DUF2332 domain-containing protein [Dermatophilaceae bacterium]